MSELLPPEAPNTLVLNKKDLATALLVLQAFPIAILLDIERKATLTAHALNGMLGGSPLPQITRIFLSNYHFLWIAPLVTTALAFTTLRRSQNTGTLPALCLVLTLLAGLGAWQLANLALTAPIIDLISQLSAGRPNS